jgi:hypothetical protein
MRTLLALLGLAVVVLIVLMSLGMVSLSGGSLPSVAVEPGTAPKVDVGRIAVSTENKTVEMPIIKIEKADNTAAATQ